MLIAKSASQQLFRRGSVVAMNWKPPDSMRPIRFPKILLVDDHPAVLQQTIRLLPEDYEVVETLESGFGLKAAVSRHEPDLIVLDITLPGFSGIELAARLRQSGFSTKIVFLTVHCDTDYAREAFAAGANGYVVKARLASDLVPALEAALAGKRFISPCAELEGWDDGEP